MIENFTIMTKGGLVLWSNELYPLRGNPINFLVNNVLLADRIGEKQFNTREYTLKWTLDNHNGLVFVVIYQQSFPVFYAEELLQVVKDRFAEEYQKQYKTSRQQQQQQQQDVKTSNGKFLEPNLFSDFTEMYQQVLHAVEQHSREKKKQMRSKAQAKGRQEATADSDEQVTDSESEEDGSDNTLNGYGINGEQVVDAGSGNEEQPSKEEQIEQNKKVYWEKQKQKKNRNKKNKKKKQQVDSDPSNTSQKPAAKPKKQMRVWDNGKVSAELEKELDIAGTSSNEASAAKADEVQKQKFMPDANAKIDLDLKISEKKNSKSKGFFGSLKSMLKGEKELTEDMLTPIMQQAELVLKEKNVEVEVADKLCKSVKENLVGRKVGTFTNVKAAFKDAMGEALTRVLTPKNRVDILREIEEARKQMRPYSITMVGINGVGKSTSLAKLCFWLKQNNLKIMIAACDTFRSGAVEQLETHARYLQLPLYQRGYGKEPAQIAKEALEFAKQQHIDVVLIDTAGRMQHNQTLMEALARLVQVNRPDRVLFVGEALVGNDGVDQLRTFNNSLKRFTGSAMRNERENLIDGVFLTKFDTVDEKVGAAVSMVHSTGIPVLFVGVGQQYVDLKTLSVDAVVNALLN